jgi:hypothetical protein
MHQVRIMWRDLHAYICPRRRLEILQQIEAMVWNLLEDVRDLIWHLENPPPSRED